MVFGVVAGLVVLVVVALFAARVARAEVTRLATREVDDAKMQAAAERKAAELEAHAQRTATEAAARQQALDASAKVDDELAERAARLQRREDALRGKQAEVAQLED